MKNPLFSSPARLPEGVRVVLASASPRRRELLTDMGFDFEIIPAECDESVDSGILPRDAARILAARKCAAVAQELPESTLVIAADTLVDLFDTALGKPKDEDDAFRMLCEMSGKKHFVHTGISVFYKGKQLSDVDTTSVQFLRYTPEEAWTYVLTGEPMDKAGAYGIQGLGGGLVDRTEGQMDTVVGLPTLALDRLICALLDSLKGGEDA